MIVKYSYGIDQVISSKANVIDQYKQSKTEEIRADLQKHRSDIVMILQHVNYNINIGSVIRSNNAFFVFLTDADTFVFAKADINCCCL